jgi:hypothetical protein
MNHRLPDDERDGRVESFRYSLKEFEKKMFRLEEAILVQMKFLSDKRYDRQDDFLHKSLKRQERLRSRIRCVERGFFLLKSEWMTWLWSIPS